jgi:hypothetical protein
MGPHGQQRHWLDRVVRDAHDGVPMTGGLHDEHERAIAAQAERDHPHWAVLWGTHTRHYWAYPRFQAPPGTIIAAADLRTLAAQMNRAELTASNPPPAPRGNDTHA